jgi:hypothetical protein
VIIYALKQCSRCKGTKLNSEFFKSSTGASGLKAQCKSCSYLTKKESYLRVPEEERKQLYRVRSEKWIAANQERRKEIARNYYHNNKEKVKAYQTSPRAKELYQGRIEKARAGCKAWREANLGAVLAIKARRRAAELQRTPAWLSEDHLALIETIYKSKPKGWHVDHIVPLQGKTVSGLHVPWNLQHLPALENIRKGNKVIET